MTWPALPDNSPIIQNIRSFMALLNDSQLRVVYAGAASVADYSCLAKTVRQIDEVLWHESEKELQFRGIQPKFSCDLTLVDVSTQELRLTPTQTDLLPVVALRVLGSCLYAAEIECDDDTEGQPYARLLGAMILTLNERLLRDGFKIEDAYSLKPEDL